jgi:hypothetical protein
MVYWLLLALAATIVASVGVYAWARGKAVEVKEKEEYRRQRDQLLKQEAAFRNEVHLKTFELKAKERLLEQTRAAFDRGYINGRRWLTHLIGEADKAMDDYIGVQLRNKHREASSADLEVARLQAERRQLKGRVKYLEYQLVSYKEYFPFLEDYENPILDEAVQLHLGHDDPFLLEHKDPVLKYLSNDEYERLTVAERDQLALDRYLRNGLTPASIGSLYDRYIGYLYEREGWEVRYQPIAVGVKGLSKDLICSKDDLIHYVHVRCWAPDKLIHERHILNLYGTVQMLSVRLCEDQLFAPKIVPRLITNAHLSQNAREAALHLGVEVKENFKLNSNFPMIKCRVDAETRERIYHLPFDEQYDDVQIEPQRGECYARTVFEAEQLGFRRAGSGLPIAGPSATR